MKKSSVDEYCMLMCHDDAPRFLNSKGLKRFLRGDSSKESKKQDSAIDNDWHTLDVRAYLKRHHDTPMSSERVWIRKGFIRRLMTYVVDNVNSVVRKNVLGKYSLPVCWQDFSLARELLDRLELLYIAGFSESDISATSDPGRKDFDKTLTRTIKRRWSRCSESDELKKLVLDALSDL